MERTCCPQYTIRLEASHFAPSREHRRLQRRLSAYMAGTLDLASCAAAAAADGGDGGDGGADRAPARDRPGAPMELGAVEAAPVAAGAAAAAPRDEVAEAVAAAVAAAVEDVIREGVLPPVRAARARARCGAPPALRARLACSQDGKYAPPRVAPPAAKVAGRVPAGTAFCCAAAHALAAAGAQAGGSARSEDVAASLASALQRPGALPASLRCRASGAFLNFLRDDAGDASTGDAAAGAERGGKRRAPRERPAPKEPRRSSPPAHAAAGAAPDVAMMAAAGGAAGAGTDGDADVSAALAGLEVRFVPSSFDDEEFELYCRYQAAVHGDSPSELSQSAYQRFLVASPLLPEPGGASRAGGAPACGFGSFHQQYRLRGRLVAVGVVDVLPRCLSSKYLFWEPELAPLCLGKYSALADIAWVAKQQAGPCPSLAHYYLGFYIHSCAKMRYKAAFKPSELLCPVTRRWVPFAAAAAALDGTGRPPRLAPQDAQPLPEAAPEPGRVALFCPGRGVTRLDALPAETREQQRDDLAAWAQSVGPVVAARAAYVCWLPGDEAAAEAATAEA